MKSIVVFEGNLFEATMVQHLLENNGIESFLQDETMGTRGGYVWRSSGGVRVAVMDEFAEKALLLIQEM
jgi:hypothetical protein